MDGDVVLTCKDNPEIDDPTGESARCRLLRAAIDAFDRKGYAAATVREIVEQAGVTKPVLYYHFGSKEGLMTAILDGAVRELTQIIERERAAAGSAQDRIRSLCSALAKTMEGRGSELRAVHAVYFVAPDLLPAVNYQHFGHTVVAELQALVQSGVDSGEFRSVPAYDAALLIGSVLGTIFDQEAAHIQAQLRGVDLSRLLDLIFDGFRPMAPNQSSKENKQS